MGKYFKAAKTWLKLRQELNILYIMYSVYKHRTDLSRSAPLSAISDPLICVSIGLLSDLVLVSVHP